MKWSTIIFIVLVSVINTKAMAGESNGKVTAYWVAYYNNNFFFQIENKADRPACDTIGSIGRWAVDVSLPKGKAVMSAILSAKATGDTVVVSGTGTCTVSVNSEDISHLMVK